MNYNKERAPGDGRIPASRAFLKLKGYKLDEGYFIEPPAALGDEEFEGDTRHVVTTKKGERIGVFYSTKQILILDNPSTF
jgi:hypothetical protein